MSIEYRIDSSENIVYTRQIGDISVEQVESKLDAIIADPHFRQGMDAVCDYTDATLNWSLTDLDRFRSYVSRKESHFENGKWAVIIPQGKDTSTARLFIALHSAFSHSFEVKIFRDQETALGWLRQSPEIRLTGKTAEN